MANPTNEQRLALHRENLKNCDRIQDTTSEILRVLTELQRMVLPATLAPGEKIEEVMSTLAGVHTSLETLLYRLDAEDMSVDPDAADAGTFYVTCKDDGVPHDG